MTSPVSQYQLLIKSLVIMMITDQIDDLKAQGITDPDPNALYECIMDTVRETLVEDFQEELSCRIEQMFEDGFVDVYGKL